MTPAIARRIAPGLLAALLALLAPFAAMANEAAPASQDPVIEKQMLAVAAELRCLVCQNQTIADSNAELAVDLREQVREMLRKGQTQEQIIEYMTARYGDFVLYRPPFKASTLLLWAGPALLLLIGLSLFWRTLHQQGRREAAAAPVSADEARRADALLAAADQSTTAETKPK